MKERHESYFHQPGFGNVLKVGMRGTACCNIRTALSSLGYCREWQRADVYDDELQGVVRRLQERNGHKNVDGWVGPGTRKLLVERLQEISFDFSQLLEVFEYDAALSFAGEDRQHAEELATMLSTNGFRVFYDQNEQVVLWGKNLLEHFGEVYGRRARFCVIFASSAYAKKVWPTQERQAAQERALQDLGSEYILPVRLDDTKIPGLASTIGYLGIERGIPEIGRILMDKIVAHRTQRVSLWTEAHSDSDRAVVEGA